MPSPITRHFITLGDRQIHYRVAGKGAPVVLLHQTPTSSRECEPLMRRLAAGHRVFAPDMPGYGASDPLPERPFTIETLADNVATFMDAVGIEVAGMYGFHTGASVATAFARRHPTRVSVAVAVGLLCLTPEERSEWLQQYAPPFVPHWDGGHLAWLWSRLKDQSVFFPWFKRTAAARVAMDALGPAAVQASVPDWLRSAQRYGDAYEAAFRYRPEADLPSIRTPHVVVDFATDPLFAHLERLPAPPANVDIIRCATLRDAQAIACEALQRHPGSPADSPVPPARAHGGVWQDYVSVAGMQLRVLRAGTSDARPVMLQHRAQSSANALAGLIGALGRQGVAFAVEFPGHGESDAAPDPEVYRIESLATVLAGALEALGVTELDLIGVEAGAAAQAALAARGGARVRHCSLVSAIDASIYPELQQGLIANYPPPPVPDMQGGHLMRAWHEARDHLLFFPWYDRRRACATPPTLSLDPALLQRSVTDSILAGAAGVAIRQAEIRHPLRAQLSRLSTLGIDVSLAAPLCDPRFGITQRLADAAGCGFVELPCDTAAWGRVIRGG
jgi:pimeloyl-ACP methyl ester carboxylesterase